jgi:hypothetical protein
MSGAGWVLGAIGLAIAILTGCSSGPATHTALPGSATTTKSEPNVLKGSDPTLVAQADCGEDGVANVHIVYGTVDQKVLVGRNPTTQAAGGSKSFSSNYGMGRGDENVLFTITTEPTTGTCKTTLTDYDSGDVIAEKETSGRATLQVLLTGKD